MRWKEEVEELVEGGKRGWWSREGRRKWRRRDR